MRTKGGKRRRGGKGEEAECREEALTQLTGMNWAVLHSSSTENWLVGDQEPLTQLSGMAGSFCIQVQRRTGWSETNHHGTRLRDLVPNTRNSHSTFTKLLLWEGELDTYLIYPDHHSSRQIFPFHQTQYLYTQFRLLNPHFMNLST